MHIAINTLPLDTTHALRGTGVYTQNLVDALRSFGKKHSYTLFTRTKELPGNTDVVHYPFFDPFFLTLPLRKPFPTVVTVHDLIPIVYPDRFPRGVRGEMKWRIQRRSLMGAARIITDSRQSARDIHRILRYDAARIDSVPLAPRSTFRPLSDAKALTDIIKKYALEDRFVLYVGDINWNKNVKGLLNAWNLLRHGSGDFADVKLVLVGSAFLDTATPEAREIQQVIAASRIRNSVVFTGYVSDTELMGLYTLSTCAVVPSLIEGFGFPVVEAYACGTPVVASDIAAFGEIMGPGFRCDPKDAASMRDALAGALALSPPERSAMVTEGLEWVQRFTWQETAHKTIQAYEKVLG